MLIEWLQLLARWIHVIAGIMWIGDSFLFMWLDRQLEPKGHDEQIVGEMWMVHSGGFYEVIKRKYLKKDEMPRNLHWFKWESYTTWISGACLLVLVYYLGGAVFLVDPTTSPVSNNVAIAIGVGSMIVAWIIYDLAASTIKNLRVFGALGLAAITGVAYGYTRVFQGRAAFLHLGALLATIMALNVFMRIIPAQRRLLADAKPDVSLGTRAKLRSTHNHYLTLPVLFLMLSNHFSQVYGNWLVVPVMVAFGVTLKQFMITRAPALAGVGCALFVGAAVMTAPTTQASTVTAGAPVSFERAKQIIQTRCVGCHAQRPTTGGFVSPPSGVVFESDDAIKAYAERIKLRAVTTKTMPLGNLTAITEEERQELGRWVDNEHR